jgi:fumarate reductase flavoprotein subunit
MEKAPFHAVPLIAGITFAMAGLPVNRNCQVPDQEERVIEGLYAAGGSIGGLQGGPGLGYTGVWSEASTFGLRAAGHVAASIATPARS